VHLIAGQPVARAETAEACQHLVLESTTTLELRLGGSNVGQELADQGADRRVLLGRPDSGTTVHLNRQ